MSTLRTPTVRFYDVQREMNRFLDSFFPTTARRRTDEDGPESAVWRPVVDVHEDEQGFLIDAELPGLTKEDVKIDFQDGTLTVAGERSYSYEKKEGDATAPKNAHRLERFYGKFLRSFTFPSAVNSDAISAHFQDGVLKIMVPKAEELKPKRIEIQ